MGSGGCFNFLMGFQDIAYKSEVLKITQIQTSTQPVSEYNSIFFMCL